MKKWSVMPIALAGAMVLVGCSESPEKNLTDEQIKEFEVEKELNKISGVVDENFKETESVKQLYADKTNVADKILSGKVKIKGQELGVENVLFGYDGEWDYAVERLLKMEFMKESLKEKDIEQMKVLIKEKYYPNNKEVADYVLEEDAVFALYNKNKNKPKEKAIIEFYEKYYIEDIYRGLIDLPRYEDDKELYEIYYLLDGKESVNESLDIADIIKKADFKEGYEWIKQSLLEEEVSSIPSERKLKDVVFSYGKAKYTVKDIGEMVFAENYLYEYERMKKQQRYAVIVKESGYDVEAFGTSLKLIGIDSANEEDLLMGGSYISLIKEDKLVDEAEFKKYYAEKVKMLELEKEISENQYIKDYYRFEYFIDVATEGLMKKIEDKVEAVKVDGKIDVTNEEIEAVYQEYKKEITQS